MDHKNCITVNMTFYDKSEGTRASSQLGEHEYFDPLEPWEDRFTISSTPKHLTPFAYFDKTSCAEGYVEVLIRDTSTGATRFISEHRSPELWWLVSQESQESATPILEVIVDVPEVDSKFHHIVKLNVEMHKAELISHSVLGKDCYEG